MIVLESELFALADAWGGSPEQYKDLPVSRRKRAVRWKKLVNESNERKAKNKEGKDPQFDREVFTNEVWHTPLGLGFGDQ